MALSGSSLGISRFPYFSCTRLKRKLPRSFVARSQSFPDYGKGGSNSNTVDSNMSVLRKRIEAVRRRERVGWNYMRSYSNVLVRRKLINIGSIHELATIVFTSIGLVFLSGSLSILLLSFLLSPPI